jgi:catechol 2,3-dioxygenase-like lactoylglutathione lyase family enzyme
MKRAFPNVLCADVQRSAAFYEAILGMTRHADFGWFVILTHPAMPHLEFGLLDRRHETVPNAEQDQAGGVLLTFVVDDLDAIARNADAHGADIVEHARDMPYGQRRMVLRDPDGTFLNDLLPDRHVTPPTAPKG